MSWHDRLVKASFRGMDFLTESHEAKLGRRLVIHEFPGADVPLIEDLGTKATEVHLTAYFIGADYDLERNKLLWLLNKTGAAWLDHPWLGRIEVCAKEWSLSESNDKGGYCTVTIDFVPAGMVITEPKVDHVDNATEKMVALSDSAEVAFSLSVMSMEASAEFIINGYSRLTSLENMLSMAALPLIALDVISSIKSIKSDFVSLLVTPILYVAELRYAIDSLLSIDSVLSDADRPRVIAYLTSLAIRYPLQSSLLSLRVAPSTSLELSANIQKDMVLHSCFLIAVAGQLALTDYRAIDVRDAALANVLTAIDKILPVLPDEVFQAAVAARVAIYDALMVQDLQPTQQQEVFYAMPSIVLAHRFELIDADFSLINAPRHPLFVQGVIYG